MPRKPAHTPDQLVDAALGQFWAHGFSATSMDDLVRATGVSRHGIYKVYAGKNALFAAVFDRYDVTVVSPAFAEVEATGATLAAVASYFEQQISLAEEAGLPGPGCLIANTQSEPASHAPAVREAISTHRMRLRSGFANAIRGEAPSLPEGDVAILALALLTSAQGLWLASRVIKDANELRAIAGTIVSLIRTRITHA